MPTRLQLFAVLLVAAGLGCFFEASLETAGSGSALGSVRGILCASTYAASLALFSVVQRWVVERRGGGNYLTVLTGWIGVMIKAANE